MILKGGSYLVRTGTTLSKTQRFSKSELGNNHGGGRGYDTVYKMRKAELPFFTRRGKKSCIKPYQ